MEKFQCIHIQLPFKFHVKYLGEIEFAEFLISNLLEKAAPSPPPQILRSLSSFTALSMRKISTSFERILNFSSKPVNALLLVYSGLLVSLGLELVYPVYRTKICNDHTLNHQGLPEGSLNIIIISTGKAMTLNG